VVWLIENAPDLEITGSPFCQLHGPEGGFAEAAAAWDRAIEARAGAQLVLLRAAHFFAIYDRERSRKLLEQGEREQPSWPNWANELGQAAMLEVHFARRLEATGEPAKVKPDELRAFAREALGHFERALSLVTRKLERFAYLPKCATAALECGQLSAALNYTDETLALAPECASDRHRPDHVHTAHIVRGHVALEANLVDAAKRELVLAGAQGSANAPILRSFGPDFRLAARLLDRGERTAVLDYLTQCSTFWKEPRVARWRQAILRGERPNMFTGFDPNEHREE
jgi:tetratricopeptide (TPR) repeat protein